MAKKPALSIDTLHKKYDNGTHALKGISFDIQQGEFFALLGPNGSGKTTMINILSGPTKRTSGTIRVMGKDIHDYREETKMMIGVVPQEISFDSFFTVNEVLLLQSGYYGIKNNQKHIDEILEKLNLHEKKHTNTRALSGGMKRRLLVAKALVHKPKIVILDEPTAGVDVELRHNLWHYMRELNKEGQTILLTTHYLEEAESLCKRTAIINKGELVALDDTQKLIKSMGNKKQFTLVFNKKVGSIPSELKEFNAHTFNDHEIKIDFETKDLNKVLNALKSLKDPIVDLDLDSQNLEDVFIQLTYRNNG